MLCLDAQSCSILCNSMDCVACQAPLSMGYSRQEYWSGLSCPPPGDLPNPGIELRSPALQADSLPFEPQGKPLKTVRVVDKKMLTDLEDSAMQDLFF